MLSIPSQLQFLKNHTFIDLFAGIGGFHYAFASFGARCVFASEIDKKAASVYQKNHGLAPHGDIRSIAEEDIPSHDILCAGFPCQAFSISGKQRGFEDTRGTLFFDIARIVKHHQPSVLLLENVKNFARHDKGNTLKVVLTTLQELNYTVFYTILNTRHFGLPQNRERIYFVAFHHRLNVSDFSFPIPRLVSCLQDVLQHDPYDGKVIQREDIDFYKKYIPQYDEQGSLKYPNQPVQIGKVNKGGQGERIYHPHGHAITLSAHGGGVGSKTGLYFINNKIRKLSPRECARLQGFPEDFILPDSVSQAHRMFGNSVSIDVLQYIIKAMGEVIEAKTNGANQNLLQ